MKFTLALVAAFAASANAFAPASVEVCAWLTASDRCCDFEGVIQILQ
jgi:hypothetical protein